MDTEIHSRANENRQLYGEDKLFPLLSTQWWFPSEVFISQNYT
jgi:hypothetical protein